MASFFKKPGNDAILKVSKPRSIVTDEDAEFDQMLSSVRSANKSDRLKIISSYMKRMKQTKSYNETISKLASGGYCEISAENASSLKEIN